MTSLLSDGQKWSCACQDALEWLRSLPERSVSLWLTSPPYEGQRTYGIGFSREGQDWVDWMRSIVKEMCRCCSGLVCVNMASPIRYYKYTAAVEWLVADLTRLDGITCGPSPYAWVKSENYEDALGNGTPGSGGRTYQRRDWEPVYCFAIADRLPLIWSDNKAFGKAPQYAAGGEFSNRIVDGRRANTKKHTKRMEGKGHETGDKMELQYYVPPNISNPGNVIRVPVGGGKLGHPLAHAGEAPMALGLAERFVCWFAPPDSIVGDCFAGTGTTADAAIQHGRRFIGCDIRQSQIDIIKRRLESITPCIFQEPA